MSAANRQLLVGLLDDAAVELEILAERVRPDFADIVARAERLDPSRGLGARVDEARGLDGLRDEQLEGVARIGDLDALLACARDDLADAAAANDRSGVPPMRVESPARRGRGTAWVVVLGVAALFVAALSLGWGLRARTFDRTQSREYSGANKVKGGDEWSQARIDEEPRRAPKAASRSTVPAPPVVVPMRASTPPPPPAAAAAPRKVGPSTTERLVAIDRTGRAAWKRGDLQAAEAAFEDLVRAGGRRSIVDLAYGDLFELARQRHDSARETRLWQRYLRRFPNGRFADEAFAGLCRRAAGARAKASAKGCWQSYLDERPHGTYRDHARAALGTPGPG